MIRNVLDHRHEAVRSPMGEAIAVDGSGLHLLRRSYFSAMTNKKRETVFYLLRKERAFRTLQPSTLASSLPRYTNL